jgi:catechol 2,3-dioxygenase-like lactoylglutathione lyase family enzyme
MLGKTNMPDAVSVAPHVNGVLETSLYVQSAARSAEFYREVFGFNVISPMPGEGLDDNTRLCAMRAGDRSVLLLFRRGGTPDTDAQGAIHIAFGISRSDIRVWEDWLGRLGISIESRKQWQYGAEALYFRDPDGHLLEVVTPGVWEVY